MSDQENLIHIEEEPDTGRRRALQYLVGCLAAAAVNPPSSAAFMAQSHDSHAASGSPAKKKYRPLITGKPTFFKSGEYKTLTRMVDLIIPRTDTPGAANAGVPLYIDIVAGADPVLGPRFRKGLAELDAASRAVARKRFGDAKEPAQIKILESMSVKNAPGNEFFESVKAMTIVGYYSSEIGLYEELHFVGNQALSSFTGCPHGGHSLDVPRAARRADAIQDPTRLWPFPSSDNIVGDDQ